MNCEIIQLINKIYEMEGVSLSDKILDYCETYDKDIQEVGDILSESEDFKKIMLNDCIKNNIIKDERKFQSTEVFAAW